MLVLDGVLCTRGRSSVASPAVAVSGAWTAWTGHLSGTCLAVKARANCRRLLAAGCLCSRCGSAPLGSDARRTRAVFADAAAGENGRARRGWRVEGCGQEQRETACGAVRKRQVVSCTMELAQRERDERTGQGPRSLSQLALCGMVVSVCLHTKRCARGVFLDRSNLSHGRCWRFERGCVEAQ
jgi:hypothetical protein